MTCLSLSMLEAQVDWWWNERGHCWPGMHGNVSVPK